MAAVIGPTMGRAIGPGTGDALHMQTRSGGVSVSSVSGRSLKRIANVGSHTLDGQSLGVTEVHGSCATAAAASNNTNTAVARLPPFVFPLRPSKQPHNDVISDDEPKESDFYGFNSSSFTPLKDSSFPEPSSRQFSCQQSSTRQPTNTPTFHGLDGFLDYFSISPAPEPNDPDIKTVIPNTPTATAPFHKHSHNRASFTRPRHHSGSHSYSAQYSSPLSAATSQFSATAADTANTTLNMQAYTSPSPGDDGPSFPPRSGLYAALRRMEAQNAAIREAWEAERRYLEANRARAEEVYREERAVMDEQTTLMEQESEALTTQVYELKERMRLLEKENDYLRHRLSSYLAKSPTAQQELITVDTALANLHGESRSSNSSPGVPGSGAVTARPLYARATSALLSPVPFQGPTAPKEDFLAATRGTPILSTQTAPVDIGQIDPALEGIPLKAAALKSPTFTDTNPVPALSPELDTLEQLGEASEAGETSVLDDESDIRSEAPTECEPPLALTAHESFRLRVHAGHTPSHSISNLSALTATTASTSVVGSEGGPTPGTNDDSQEDLLTMRSNPSRGRSPPAVQVYGHPLRDSQAVSPPPPTAAITVPDLVVNNDDAQSEMTEDVADSVAVSDLGESIDGNGDGILTPPAHDRPLTGPLMITNVPAKDEIFLAQLAAKLEEVKISRETSPESWRGNSKARALDGQDSRRMSLAESSPWQAPPVVALEGAGDDGMGTAGVVGRQRLMGGPSGASRPRVVPEFEGGAGAMRLDDGESDEEIPLKLKKTQNFGLPMGVGRSGF